MVEHRPVEANVAGSNPVGHPKISYELFVIS